MKYPHETPGERVLRLDRERRQQRQRVLRNGGSVEEANTSADRVIEGLDSPFAGRRRPSMVPGVYLIEEPSTVQAHVERAEQRRDDRQARKQERRERRALADATNGMGQPMNRRISLTMGVTGLSIGQIIATAFHLPQPVDGGSVAATVRDLFSSHSGTRPSHSADPPSHQAAAQPPVQHPHIFDLGNNGGLRFSLREDSDGTVTGMVEGEPLDRADAWDRSHGVFLIDAERGIDFVGASATLKDLRASKRDFVQMSVSVGVSIDGRVTVSTKALQAWGDPGGQLIRTVDTIPTGPDRGRARVSLPDLTYWSSLGG